MIVKMLKAHVVARRSDQDRLLQRLRELGVLHLAPVNPARAGGDEALAARIGRMDRAVQLASGLSPSGRKIDLPAEQAAQEILRIHQQSTDCNSRLNSLYHQMRQLELWGDVRLEQLRQIQESGLRVGFYLVDRKQADQVQADLVQPLRELPGGRMLVATVQRQGEPTLPPSAQLLPDPTTDAPTLRAEAARIDAALAQDQARLANLAGLSAQMARRRGELQRELEFVQATRGGLESPGLFAVQGYVPAPQAAPLQGQLDQAQIAAAVELQDVSADEQPPTQIRYPGWVKPIKGLFDILNIQPGYRELDVSTAFVIALPLFAAMLISDAGYGLLFLLVPLLTYRRAVAKMGRNLAHLVILIGAASVAWGILTGSFFGLDVYGLLLHRPPPVRVDLGDESRRSLMALSFYIGAAHLVIARVWRAVVLAPRPAFLSQLGWGAFLWGMLGVVRYFVLAAPNPLTTYHVYLLIGGGALAVMFSYPSWNILKMVGLGLANFPLSALGAFSDIMSYVRLMAVGLAGSVLAVAFNNLAVSAGPVLMAPILVVGHGLNIGLVMIALFAHGVRLNVLEFSNNIGMEWSGYPYRPFAEDHQEK
jgi:V/A-type H+-transporting ATPase subunit I